MLKAIVAGDPRLEGVNLHPHKFRAYLATYMARHGAAIEDIKEVLGHSNIQTTDECYTLRTWPQSRPHISNMPLRKEKGKWEEKRTNYTNTMDR